MPLTTEDTARLYGDAFARTAKTMMGEQSFAYADLKAQFDVAQWQMGVLQDELKAAQAELETLKAAPSNPDEAAAAASQGTA